MHEEMKAKLADEECGAVILAGEGREVPGLNAMLPEFNELNSFDLGGFFELVDLLFSQTEMFIVEQEIFILLLLFLLAFNLVLLTLNLF